MQVLLTLENSTHLCLHLSIVTLKIIHVSNLSKATADQQNHGNIDCLLIAYIVMKFYVKKIAIRCLIDIETINVTEFKKYLNTVKINNDTLA